MEDQQKQFVQDWDRRLAEYMTRRERNIPEMPEEQKAKAEAYFKSLNETKGHRAQTIRRSMVNEMPYDVARKKVWEVFCKREVEIEAIEGTPFRFEFAETQRAVLIQIVKYFICDQSCEYPLKKGLFLYGEYGTGKSELMRIMEAFCEENKLHKQFIYTSLSNVYNKAKADAKHDPIEPNVQFSRCFDEFMRHHGSVTHYGESIDINEALIEQRYERFQRYGQITHFVSNQHPNDIKEKLSPMAFDRLRAMVTSVHYPGTSKRK